MGKKYSDDDLWGLPLTDRSDPDQKINFCRPKDRAVLQGWGLFWESFSDFFGNPIFGSLSGERAVKIRGKISGRNFK